MNFFWGLLSTRDFFLHPSRFELHIQVLSFFLFFFDIASVLMFLLQSLESFCPCSIINSCIVLIALPSPWVPHNSTQRKLRDTETLWSSLYCTFSQYTPVYVCLFDIQVFLDNLNVFVCFESVH